MRLRRIHDEDGLAMITAILVTAIVLVLAVSAVNLALRNSNASGADRRRLEAINAAEAGVSSSGPSVTTCGTVSVWNGAGYTSSAAPSSGGTWSTQPANLSFTTSGGYTYTMTANLGSNPSSTSQSPSGASGSATRTEAKAVVGSPVAGTITYQLTDPSSHVLVNVTMTIDLGNCTAYAKYTQAT